MKHTLSLLFGLICLAIMQGNTQADTKLLNVEELRIDLARNEMPEVFEPLASVVSEFKLAVKENKSVNEVKRATERFAYTLWREATESLRQREDWDDRPLYWARLEMREALKRSPAVMSTSNLVKNRLLDQLELISRGQYGSSFNIDADIKILVTGFDPFFLDRNIDQSNPSGVAAMWLDGKQYDIDGLLVEIQAYVVPVRFTDFDQGMIETLLTRHYRGVDMIATISMGRSDFDLERFPGRRRSAEAPDNLNVLTGANAENPLIPLLNGAPIEGPEFVEFSLPVKAMQKAEGEFKVIDNRKVKTLKGEIMPETLTELDDEIAVTGGGGGYLSNEISYRSVVLRNKFRPELPVGHIHTPRIKAFEPETTQKIVEQIEAMLKLSVPHLKASK